MTCFQHCMLLMYNQFSADEFPANKLCPVNHVENFFSQFLSKKRNKVTVKGQERTVFDDV